MDASLYALIIISTVIITTMVVLVLGVLSGQMATFHRLSEESRNKAKEVDEKQSAFLRHMHIESKKDSRETKRLLEKIEETNSNIEETNSNMEETNAQLRQISKENSVYLRMIFERVDKPNELEG